MYQGYYINLDRNGERRQKLAAHLQEMDAADRYQRLEAVDGQQVAGQYATQLSPGQLGCWLSHVKALAAGRDASAHLHIIEDDTIFARGALAALDETLTFAETRSRDWDLLFTDIYVAPVDFMACKDLLRTAQAYRQTQQLGLLNLERVTFSGTSSYFVNRKSVEKVRSLLETPAADATPIDLYLRLLVHRKLLTAYVTAPFLTSISPDSALSDVAGEQDSSRAVFDILRRSLFRDADLAALDTELEQFVAGIAPSDAESLYFKVLRFVMSDRYVHF